MKQTALHAVHAALGAKLIEFGGWSMPVQYGPILDEAQCVRSSAGLFDLGHMGRVHVSGPDTLRFLDKVCTNFVAKIPVGAIRYSLFCRADGNPIDDLLVYREKDSVYLVINAGNTAVDLAWLREQARGFAVTIDDQTERTGMLALQGQRAHEVLQTLVTGLDLATIGYYKFSFGTVCGLPNTRLSRTGYTGEDGFEIYLDNADCVRVWNAVLEAGRAAGVRPIGLGARDILRLEAGMPLYGHEIDEDTDPISAGLGFAVKLDKGQDDERAGRFIGQDALQRIAAAGPARKLVGLVLEGRRSARQGMQVKHGNDVVGRVTSGCLSPTLDKPIAMAFVDASLAEVGTSLSVDLGRESANATVTKMPFVSATRS